MNRTANRTIRFRPGALEDVALILSTRHHHAHARVVGWFPVYCGAGNEHRVWIESDRYCAGSCAGAEELAAAFLAAAYDAENYEEMAHVLVEGELEDWRDPCGADGP